MLVMDRNTIAFDNRIDQQPSPVTRPTGLAVDHAPETSIELSQHSLPSVRDLLRYVSSPEPEAQTVLSAADFDLSQTSLSEGLRTLASRLDLTPERPVVQEINGTPELEKIRFSIHLGNVARSLPVRDINPENVGAVDYQSGTPLSFPTTRSADSELARAA